MIKDAIKEISKVHKYKVTGEYWSRVGAMRKRYGEDTLIKAINKVPEQEIPLSTLLNMVERKCQYILENGELDDLSNEILNL
jgi:hypothetical protein